MDKFTIPPVITKTPSLKELIETKLGPNPDPMQELRDLVLSEITTAFGGNVTSAAPSIAKQVTFADIEAFSKYLDEPGYFDMRTWRNTQLTCGESGRIDSFRFVDALTRFSPIKPTKETPVNTKPLTKPLTITTKTFTYVNGVDVNNYSANELYDMIAREESKIRTLEAIDHKPVMLQQEIARRKDGIAALVAHLDAATVVPTPAPAPLTDSTQ